MCTSSSLKRWDRSGSPMCVCGGGVTRGCFYRWTLFSTSCVPPAASELAHQERLRLLDTRHTALPFVLQLDGLHEVLHTEEDKEMQELAKEELQQVQKEVSCIVQGFRVERDERLAREEGCSKCKTK